MSHILPLEDHATWQYEVTLVDAQGWEQPRGVATIRLSRVHDFIFGRYFTDRADAPLDTIITAGPFEVSMEFTEQAEGSQFWLQREDARLIWFENKDGLFTAFTSGRFDFAFWGINRLVPAEPEYGERWGTSVDSYSTITSIDSILVDGSYQSLVSVDWIHVGTPWQHRLRWSRGSGLVEIHDWVLHDYVQTGERYIYRLKP